MRVAHQPERLAGRQQLRHAAGGLLAVQFAVGAGGPHLRMRDLRRVDVEETDALRAFLRRDRVRVAYLPHLVEGRAVQLVAEFLRLPGQERGRRRREGPESLARHVPGFVVGELPALVLGLLRGEFAGLLRPADRIVPGAVVRGLLRVGVVPELLLQSIAGRAGERGAHGAKRRARVDRIGHVVASLRPRLFHLRLLGCDLRLLVDLAAREAGQHDRAFEVRLGRVLRRDHVLDRHAGVVRDRAVGALQFLEGVGDALGQLAADGLAGIGDLVADGFEHRGRAGLERSTFQRLCGNSLRRAQAGDRGDVAGELLREREGLLAPRVHRGMRLTVGADTRGRRTGHQRRDPRLEHLARGPERSDGPRQCGDAAEATREQHRGLGHGFAVRCRHLVGPVAVGRVGHELREPRIGLAGDRAAE